MERHLELLSKLCRICGKLVESVRGYFNPKTKFEYETELRDCYGILVHEEDKEVCDFFYRNWPCV